MGKFITTVEEHHADGTKVTLLVLEGQEITVFQAEQLATVKVQQGARKVIITKSAERMSIDEDMAALEGHIKNARGPANPWKDLGGLVKYVSGLERLSLLLISKLREQKALELEFLKANEVMDNEDAEWLNAPVTPEEQAMFDRADVEEGEDWDAKDVIPTLGEFKDHVVEDVPRIVSKGSWKGGPLLPTAVEQLRSAVRDAVSIFEKHDERHWPPISQASELVIEQCRELERRHRDLIAKLRRDVELRSRDAGMCNYIYELLGELEKSK